MSRRPPKKKQQSRSGSTKSARNRLDIEYRKRRAALDKEYRQRLKALEKIGAYSPTSRTLTKSRKRSIRKAFAKFEEFLTGDYYLFVPIPTRSKKQRRKAIKLAEQNQLITSPKGVFIEKTKSTVSAKAVKSKKSGAYRIRVKKRRKGPTGEKTITETIPIAPMGTLDAELQRIKTDADELQLRKGDVLGFKVTSSGAEGYGHKIFTDPNLLINYLQSQYRQAIAHKLAFYQMISVFKTSRETYFRDRPRKKRNVYMSKIDRRWRRAQGR